MTSELSTQASVKGNTEDDDCGDRDGDDIDNRDDEDDSTDEDDSPIPKSEYLNCILAPDV